MKRISYIYSLLLISFLLPACQKVINVKLDSASREYVIEGVITDQPGYCVVSISQTKDFSSNNTFPGVSGASVTIENNGTITTLQETDSGVYSTNLINGAPGQTYKMQVSLNGQNFSASSTMPQPVGPDSVYVSKDIFSSDYYATVVYHDPAGVANYYRWVQYVNSHKEMTIFVNDDEFTDGLTISNQLSFNNGTDDPLRKIHISGDTVRIDMLCIDSAVYKYWSSLQQNGTGSGNSAAPANPISNISGGCLGYFSAQTMRSKTIVTGQK